MAPKKKAAKKRAPAKKKPGRKPAKKGKKSAKKSSGKPPKKQTGKKLNAAQQALRDSQLLARVDLQGWTVEEAAKEAGITRESASRALIAKRKTLGTLMKQDPVKIVEALVRGWQSSIGDYEQIAADSAKGNHLAVAVGAKKAADNAREKLAELLQSLGALPHDLGTVTHTVEIRAVVTKINVLVEGFLGAMLALPLPEPQKVQIESEVKQLTTGLDTIAAAPHAVQDEREETPDAG